MPPKKVQIKKQKKDLAKLENGFLNLTFLWGILSQKQVFFFEMSLIFSITYFRKKSHFRRAVFKLFWHKNQKRLERHKIKKNASSKIVLDILCRSKTAWSIVNLKNHWTLLWRLEGEKPWGIVASLAPFVNSCIPGDLYVTPARNAMFGFNVYLSSFFYIT
jgi:hypothetical protein